MATTGSINLSLQATQTISVGLGSATNALSKTVNKTFADGTAANQVNILWSSSRSLTGTAEDLDLNGVLIDAYGNSVNMLRVKGIYIGNLSTVDGQNIAIGGAGSNGWVSMFGSSTDKIKVGPSGMFCNVSPLDTGFPVTAGTADILHVDPLGATLSYEIAILGCSA